MEKYVNQGIKDVIAQFPRVGEILNTFEIGCTTCMVGTCLLKDVVGIHQLPPAAEAQLMLQLEGAFYPDRNVDAAQSIVENTKTELVYSSPMQTLVDEHKVIKRWLALIPYVTSTLQQSASAWQWVEQGVELIQNYADHYHHAKEEDILFKYADESKEIIQSMYEEHNIGRGHIREVKAAITSRDVEKAAQHLLAYRELLTQHIKKEDEILYPWFDREMTTKQIEEMAAKFIQADFAAENPQKYFDFVVSLEKQRREPLNA